MESTSAVAWLDAVGLSDGTCSPGAPTAVAAPPGGGICGGSATPAGPSSGKISGGAAAAARSAAQLASTRPTAYAPCPPSAAQPAAATAAAASRRANATAAARPTPWQQQPAARRRRHAHEQVTAATWTAPSTRSRLPSRCVRPCAHGRPTAALSAPSAPALIVRPAAPASPRRRGWLLTGQPAPPSRSGRASRRRQRPALRPPTATCMPPLPAGRAARCGSCEGRRPAGRPDRGAHPVCVRTCVRMRAGGRIGVRGCGCVGWRRGEQGRVARAGCAVPKAAHACARFARQREPQQQLIPPQALPSALLDVFTHTHTCWTC
eukprot:364615-Chlamydomonas_euryale.AAC.2